VSALARALVAALAVSSIAGCAPDRADGPDPACQVLRGVEDPIAANVVLVVNDTMRRDRMGIHGGPARTPVFDGFASDHLLFERAHSEAPWTKPAIATLFTSLYPSQHGTDSHPAVRRGSDGTEIRHNDLLPDGLTTLAEVLQSAGWQTGAFVANPWLDRRFGFQQGFDHYQDDLGEWDVPGVAVSRAALEWIGGLDPERPFFAYVHTLDSHRPYGTLSWDDVLARAPLLKEDSRAVDPPVARAIAPLIRFEGPGAERGIALRRSLALLELAYDKGIENFDAALGVLLAGLAELPGWDRTAVIVTSDHGEALFEHGYDNHGVALLDDEIAIPFAARLPGVSPERGRVSCGVGLIDVLPTLCGYLGIECPEAVVGHSLVTPDGEIPPRYQVSEGVMHHPRHRSLRNRRFKLVYEPDGTPGRGGGSSEFALYDLQADPGEAHDLLARRTPDPEASRLLEVLAPRLEQAVAAFERPAAHSAPLDPELERRLESLGYLE
jgi:arylsulfatase A-like enzyme